MRTRHLALAAILGLSSLATQAATQTLVGTTFSVTFDDTLVGLFGTPTLVGNSLQWFPSGSPGFTAQTGAGIAVTNSTFALKFEAKPGFFFNGFGLTEGGDYFFFGAPGTTAGVSVSGQLRVTPQGGVLSTSSISPTTVFNPNSFLNFGTSNWTASAAVGSFASTVTSANVSIENILAAYVLGGNGYAFVEKKDVSLSIGTSPVPEPETYALMFAGIATLFLLLRKRGTAGD